jgi:uncharacterized GH25 family protein
LGASISDTINQPVEIVPITNDKRGNVFNLSAMRVL